jgi:hypothetical protein
LHQRQHHSHKGSSAPIAPGFSLVLMPVWSRLGIVALVAAFLWIAVAWALS